MDFPEPRALSRAIAAAPNWSRVTFLRVAVTRTEHATGITELPAKIVSFAVVAGLSNALSLPVFGVSEQRWTEQAKAAGAMRHT